MQRAGLQPDVISYALLINAYGKARREEEALAVFEEMLDAGVRCVVITLSLYHQLYLFSSIFMTHHLLSLYLVFS